MNKKMITAFVEPIGGHRGNDFYDFGLCKALSDVGVDLTFYTSDETDLDQKFNFSFQVRKYFKKIFGKAPLIVRGVRFVIGIIKSVSDSKKRKARLVHLHIYHFSWQEFFLLWWFWKNNFKIIATIHDVEDFQNFGSEITISKYRKFEKRIDRIIVHSDFAKSSIKKYFPQFPEPHIHQVPHGDSDFLYSANCTVTDARKKLNLPNQKQLILFFGQIKKVKGLDVLLKAFALLREKNCAVQLVVAGPIWKVEEEEFMNIIRENKIENDCIMRLEYVPNELIPYYFRAADIVTLPYRKIYSSGVLIRSLDYASAIVASDLETFRDIISDGENGILFQSENSDDLSEKMFSLLKDKPLQAKLRMAAKKTADEKFGWKLIGEKVKTIYSLALHE